MPKLQKQLENLRLNRDVERRNRLISHDNPRLKGERSRDADTLALLDRTGDAPARLLVAARIGKARLIVFPRATLCLDCKQREERR